MRRYGYVVLAAIGVLLVSLALSSSAQANPDARIDLTINHQVLYSGQSFTATGTASVACAMDLRWNEVVRHSAPAKAFTATYVAPDVDQATRFPLDAVCQVPGAAERSADARLQGRLDVTVLPRGSGAAAATAGADLPGAGGPNRIFLLSGLVLLLAGATATTMARRRAEDVELPGQTA